jgi:GR25 family glycosyltransferase involved in LPS biosynthesis
MMSMTTCNRPDLFKRTIYSFQRFSDLDLVSHIYIVDDSREIGEVRNAAREVFAHGSHREYQIAYKKSSQRGHPQSLNIILDEVRRGGYKYFVHLEDDFEFYFAFPLISSCMRILEMDHTYGQCLFNNGYKESMREMTSKPYGRARELGGVRFYSHIYSDTYVNPASYWPHFSLRPGVYRAETFLQLGYFVESGSFEKEYAARYIDVGWRTAYLEGVYCEHIGRKTSERFSNIPNAYTLNNTPQFGPIVYKTFMIHLDRRKDRLDKINWPSFPPITICAAVDGKRLKPREELNGLFRDNIVDMKPGVIGCALSHIKLWIKLLWSCRQIGAFFILEDDVTFAENFEHKWATVLGLINARFEPWDVVFVGHHNVQPAEGDIALIQPMSAAAALQYSHGGTFGYLINHTGARKLLSFLELYGMVNAIDTVMQRCIDKGLKVLYCTIPLVLSVENSPDSDIQISESCMYDSSLKRAPWSEVKQFIETC